MKELKNVWNEPLAFTWIPMIQPGETFEVPEDKVEYYLLNPAVQAVETNKKTTKATETSVQAIE